MSVDEGNIEVMEDLEIIMENCPVIPSSTVQFTSSNSDFL